MALGSVSPPPYMPPGQKIPFPEGTKRKFDGGTWALYANHENSWVGYKTPDGGTKILPLGHTRQKNIDLDGLARYIEQTQATGCVACDED